MSFLLLWKIVVRARCVGDVSIVFDSVNHVSKPIVKVRAFAALPSKEELAIGCHDESRESATTVDEPLWKSTLIPNKVIQAYKRGEQKLRQELQ
jgi:hypothetical protein